VLVLDTIYIGKYNKLTYKVVFVNKITSKTKIPDSKTFSNTKHGFINRLCSTLVSQHNTKTKLCFVPRLRLLNYIIIVSGGYSHIG